MPWSLTYANGFCFAPSPMLFNIYMTLLRRAVWCLGVTVGATQLYLSFLSNFKEAIPFLKLCLASEMDWMRAHRLKPKKRQRCSLSIKR